MGLSYIIHLYSVAWIVAKHSDDKKSINLHCTIRANGTV